MQNEGRKEGSSGGPWSPLDLHRLPTTRNGAQQTELFFLHFLTGIWVYGTSTEKAQFDACLRRATEQPVHRLRQHRQRDNSDHREGRHYPLKWTRPPIKYVETTKEKFHFRFPTTELANFCTFKFSTVCKIIKQLSQRASLHSKFCSTFCVGFGCLQTTTEQSFHQQT